MHCAHSNTVHAHVRKLHLSLEENKLLKETPMKYNFSGWSLQHAERFALGDVSTTVQLEPRQKHVTLTHSRRPARLLPRLLFRPVSFPAAWPPPWPCVCRSAYSTRPIRKARSPPRHHLVTSGQKHAI